MFLTLLFDFIISMLVSSYVAKSLKPDDEIQKYPKGVKRFWGVYFKVGLFIFAFSSLLVLFMFLCFYLFGKSNSTVIVIVICVLAFGISYTISARVNKDK